jgi:hypothetical protein
MVSGPGYLEDGPHLTALRLIVSCTMRGPRGTRIVQQHDTCEKDGSLMKVSEDSTLPVVQMTTLTTLTEINDGLSLLCGRILH